MKKFLSLLLSASLVCLSGCGGIYANFRELEQIRVIQTMGLDYLPGGVRLSLSSANIKNDDRQALCLSGSGGSISEALENIRNSSSQNELFLSHIKQILVGEEAAAHDIEPYLGYICRSNDLRIDTPLFIVKEKTAGEIMSGSGGKSKGISEILQSLENNESERHSTRIISASEVINKLNSQGAALVSLLEYVPAAESGEGEEKEMTAALSGYAIIRENKLCGYIDSENALGADFLLNKVGISDIAFADREGRPVSMEISSGSSSIKGIWSEDRSLQGIEVFISVRAMVLEMQESPGMSDHELSDFLISRLESYVSSKTAYVLQTSRKLQADFLGLGPALNISEPYKFSSLSQEFSEILPGLQIKIYVSGELCHSKDVKDGRI